VPALRQLIPDPNVVAQLDPGNLAGHVLEVLLTSRDSDGFWSRRNFCVTMGRSYPGFDQRPHAGVVQACAEAWAWLEANGLICPNPTALGSGDWYTATRRALVVKDHQSVRSLIASQELPEYFLHADLAQGVRALFLQGRFETAVFEAFKTVEVEIRTAAELGNDLVGVQLANRAFSVEDGPLTDRAAEKGEREALRSLMAGALGSYKNPTSHRRIKLTASETREMIILASHLLQIIESRRAPHPQTNQ
jgi:uncharacterized protein (TIGR02391 family)